MVKSSNNNKLSIGKRIALLLSGVLLAIMALLLLKDASDFGDYLPILLLSGFSIASVWIAFPE